MYRNSISEKKLQKIGFKTLKLAPHQFYNYEVYLHYRCV